MILCLTHSEDYYNIDLVMEHLQSRNIPALRFNTDLFPGEINFSYELRPNGTQTMRLVGAGINLDLSTVKAVWSRKPSGSRMPEQLDESLRFTATEECITAQRLFFDQLSHVPFINTWQAEMLTEWSKFKQLQLAQSVGLNIPHTVYCSTPEAVLQLYKNAKHGVICKMHNPMSMSMNGSGAFLYTTIVTEDMLDGLDGLRYCPMIFQERVDKAYELRIAYIDGHCFAGKIPPIQNQPGFEDWRNCLGFEWQPYQLPAAEQDKLRAFMQKSGLLFGSIDVIRNTDGQYVFLEVNPSGEWGMLQKFLHYPIAQTIADTLIKLAGYA